jgi:hypothetical protein
MQIYRVTVWRDYKALSTTDYESEEEAIKARVYLLRRVAGMKKIRVNLSKKNINLKSAFNPADYDFLWEMLERMGLK